MKIVSLTAHEILASGGYPSVEAVITLDTGIRAKASVPYGASAGSREAAVLTDADQNRYQGKGMLKVVDTIKNTIAPALIGKDPEDLRHIDYTLLELDGTEDKSNLGGNALLAVSLANARAAAKEKGMELYELIADHYQTSPDYSSLPQPMAVVIEGGKHAHQSTDLQEYCLSVLSDTGPKESIRKILETYHQLKTVLKDEGLSANVGNEGAFAPSGISSNEAPFEYMLEAIDRAGYKAGEDIGFSIDAAASEFYKDSQYHLSLEGKSVSAAQLMEMYQKWFEKYPIATIEDPLDENDWENWVDMKKLCQKHNIPLIGDDLTVTNLTYLKKAIEMDAISAILIKLNQIGTLTETVDACMLAKKEGYLTVPSHRGGGETNDTAMIDLAVAVGAAFIKVGPTRGERVSKYNRLLEIERLLS